MTALSKNISNTRMLKKILVLVALLFTGLFPFWSTRQTHFNGKNKYEDNRLLVRERNKNYLLQKEKSSDKFNQTKKTDALPIQVKIKYSSRHRKGKIVYSTK